MSGLSRFLENRETVSSKYVALPNLFSSFIPLESDIWQWKSCLRFFWVVFTLRASI